MSDPSKSSAIVNIVRNFPNLFKKANLIGVILCGIIISSILLVSQQGTDNNGPFLFNGILGQTSKKKGESRKISPLSDDKPTHDAKDTQVVAPPKRTTRVLWTPRTPTFTGPPRGQRPQRFQGYPRGKFQGAPRMFGAPRVLGAPRVQGATRVRSPEKLSAGQPFEPQNGIVLSEEIIDIIITVEASPENLVDIVEPKVSGTGSLKENIAGTHTTNNATGGTVSPEKILNDDIVDVEVSPKNAVVAVEHKMSDTGSLKDIIAGEQTSNNATGDTVTPGKPLKDAVSSEKNFESTPSPNNYTGSTVSPEKRLDGKGSPKTSINGPLSPNNITGTVSPEKSMDDMLNPTKSFDGSVTPNINLDGIVSPIKTENPTVINPKKYMGGIGMDIFSPKMRTVYPGTRKSLNKKKMIGLRLSNCVLQNTKPSCGTHVSLRVKGTKKPGYFFLGDDKLPLPLSLFKRGTETAGIFFTNNILNKKVKKSLQSLKNNVASKRQHDSDNNKNIQIPKNNNDKFSTDIETQPSSKIKDQLTKKLKDLSSNNFKDRITKKIKEISSNNIKDQLPKTTNAQPKDYPKTETQNPSSTSFKDQLLKKIKNVSSSSFKDQSDKKKRDNNSQDRLENNKCKLECKLREVPLKKSIDNVQKDVKDVKKSIHDFKEDIDKVMTVGKNIDTLQKEMKKVTKIEKDMVNFKKEIENVKDFKNTIKIVKSVEKDLKSMKKKMDAFEKISSSKGSTKSKKTVTKLSSSTSILSSSKGPNERHKKAEHVKIGETNEVPDVSCYANRERSRENVGNADEDIKKESNIVNTSTGGFMNKIKEKIQSIDKIQPMKKYPLYKKSPQKPSLTKFSDTKHKKPEHVNIKEPFKIPKISLLAKKGGGKDNDSKIEEDIQKDIEIVRTSENSLSRIKSAEKIIEKMKEKIESIDKMPKVDGKIPHKKLPPFKKLSFTKLKKPNTERNQSKRNSKVGNIEEDIQKDIKIVSTSENSLSRIKSAEKIIDKMKEKIESIDKPAKFEKKHPKVTAQNPPSLTKLSFTKYVNNKHVNIGAAEEIPKDINKDVHEIDIDLKKEIEIVSMSENSLSRIKSAEKILDKMKEKIESIDKPPVGKEIPKVTAKKPEHVNTKKVKENPKDSRPVNREGSREIEDDIKKEIEVVSTSENSLSRIKSAEKIIDKMKEKIESIDKMSPIHGNKLPEITAIKPPYSTNLSFNKHIKPEHTSIKETKEISKVPRSGKREHNKGIIDNIDKNIMDEIENINTSKNSLSRIKSAEKIVDKIKEKIESIDKLPSIPENKQPNVTVKPPSLTNLSHNKHKKAEHVNIRDHKEIAEVSNHMKKEGIKEDVNKIDEDIKKEIDIMMKSDNSLSRLKSAEKILDKILNKIEIFDKFPTPIEISHKKPIKKPTPLTSSSYTKHKKANQVEVEKNKEDTLFTGKSLSNRFEYDKCKKECELRVAPLKKNIDIIKRDIEEQMKSIKIDKVPSLTGKEKMEGKGAKLEKDIKNENGMGKQKESSLSRIKSVEKVIDKMKEKMGTPEKLPPFFGKNVPLKTTQKPPSITKLGDPKHKKLEHVKLEDTKQLRPRSPEKPPSVIKFGETKQKKTEHVKLQFNKPPPTIHKVLKSSVNKESHDKLKEDIMKEIEQVKMTNNSLTRIKSAERLLDKLKEKIESADKMPLPGEIKNNNKTPGKPPSAIKLGNSKSSKTEHVKLQEIKPSPIKRKVSKSSVKKDVAKDVDKIEQDIKIEMENVIKSDNSLSRVKSVEKIIDKMKEKIQSIDKMSMSSGSKKHPKKATEKHPISPKHIIKVEEKKVPSSVKIEHKPNTKMAKLDNEIKHEIENVINKENSLSRIKSAEKLLDKLKEKMESIDKFPVPDEIKRLKATGKPPSAINFNDKTHKKPENLKLDESSRKVSKSSMKKPKMKETTVKLDDEINREIDKVVKNENSLTRLKSAEKILDKMKTKMESGNVPAIEKKK